MKSHYKCVVEGSESRFVWFQSLCSFYLVVDQVWSSGHLWQNLWWLSICERAVGTFMKTLINRSHFWRHSHLCDLNSNKKHRFHKPNQMQSPYHPHVLRGWTWVTGQGVQVDLSVKEAEEASLLCEGNWGLTQRWGGIRGAGEQGRSKSPVDAAERQGWQMARTGTGAWAGLPLAQQSVQKWTCTHMRTCSWVCF